MGFTIEHFIAGWFGGVCGLVVGHPLETLKVRQQTYGTGLWTATRRTFQYEGVFGFYKGMFFPFLAIGPSNSIFFGTYNYVLTSLQQKEIRNYTISWNDTRAIERVFTAGSIAGFCQVLFTCPIELVKTVMQAQTSGKGSWKKHYEVPYTNSFQTIKGILKERGIKGVYRGLVPMLLRDVPTSGLYSLTYEMLLYSHFFHCHNTPLSVKELVAGGAAGIVSWVLVVPMDVVKSRIQADNPEKPMYGGVVDCVKKSFEEGGYSIFFKGLPAIMVRAFIVNGMIFIGYETVLALYN